MLGSVTLERDRKPVSLALALQVQPRSENGVAIWETDQVPPLSPVRRDHPPSSLLCWLLGSKVSTRGLSLSPWTEQGEG